MQIQNKSWRRAILLVKCITLECITEDCCELFWKFWLFYTTNPCRSKFFHPGIEWLANSGAFTSKKGYIWATFLTKKTLDSSNYVVEGRRRIWRSVLHSSFLNKSTQHWQQKIHSITTHFHDIFLHLSLVAPGTLHVHSPTGTLLRTLRDPLLDGSF